MTLPASGAISFNNINVELGVAGTTQASLGQTSYRNLAGVASGQISMSNFYGKANQFAFTISSNQTNANLASLATAAGWNGSSKLVATIGSGVYISSNSTGTPGLTVNGSFPNGVSLVNNGFIVGMGGAGGKGGGNGGAGYATNAVAGSSGGLALSVSSAVSITNNGTIGGGGGGGGGGGSQLAVYYSDKSNTFYTNLGGGGGGGGWSSNAANSTAGAGGLASGYTHNAVGNAGSAGTVSAAGGGGSGVSFSFYSSGAGGAGGARGAGGGSGVTPAYTGYSPKGSAAAGGGGGGAVSGNSNITWVATGTRLGAIT